MDDGKVNDKIMYSAVKTVEADGQNILQSIWYYLTCKFGLLDAENIRQKIRAIFLVYRQKIKSAT